MSMPSSATEQIRPAVLTRLATHAQRTGKTVNALLEEMLDEREGATQPPEERSPVEAVTPDE